MAISTYTNPYGSVDPETKAFKAATSYQKTASPYADIKDPYSGITSPYGEKYQTGLADIIRAQTQSQLTGSQAQENARQSRGSMAGAGILSGTAFDRAQQQVVQNVLGQEQSQIAQQTAEARNKDLEFQSDLVAKKAAFGSDLAFKNAAFGAEQSEAEAGFNRDLWQKAIGYDTDQPIRQRADLTDRLNAIKSAYPDISKAPVDVRKNFSDIYSQLTGQTAGTGQGVDVQLPGLPTPGMREAQKLIAPRTATIDDAKRYTSGLSKDPSGDINVPKNVSKIISGLTNFANNYGGDFITPEELSAITSQVNSETGNADDLITRLAQEIIDKIQFNYRVKTKEAA